MRNIRLTLQYEGTRYLGWQRQKLTENTIQGKLEKLISKMCGEEIEIHGSGRTDAGVHAKGQVANFWTNSRMPVEEMLVYMNQYLPEDIAVINVTEAAPRFHSRLNACGKHYEYRILNSKIPDVFGRRYELEVPEPLNVEAMERAAFYLCGEHDFKSFTSAKKGKKSTVRRIDEIRITRKEDLLIFSFRGNGFLHHMIRIIMGTLLEVGKGELSPEEIPAILQGKDRKLAKAAAPAKGLTLVEVFF